MGVTACPDFILFRPPGGDTAHRVSQRVSNLVIQVEVTRFIRERGRLQITLGNAGRVFPHVLLPAGAPRRSFPEAIRFRRRDGVDFGVDVHAGTADETEARVVKTVVSKIVHTRTLRRQAVPNIDIEGEKRFHAVPGPTVVVREVVASHLAVVIGEPTGISL